MPTVEERKTMNKKPVFTVPAKTVINFASEFEEKGLCDGPTFSTGSACAYSCSFCYVETQMNRNPHLEPVRKAGMAFEDVVVRREKALELIRQQLTGKDGTPKYKDPKDRRVIYSSPLVDVAANMVLVKETVEVCKVILELTNWQIRLLSKSNLLPKVACEIPEPWKDRMIYGVSTGTLDDRLARAFEQGTPNVSKRIESLHWLQDNGYRTYGMICPSLPQDDYEKFARQMAAAIRVDRCEHVWAEVINLRGRSFKRTVEALERAGFSREAEQLTSVSGSGKKEAWEAYARATFEAHAKVIPAHKLRFLQYVTPDTRQWWSERKDQGAVVLGKETDALSTVERTRFRELDKVVVKAARSFIDAGIALEEIKVSRLYRDQFATFEAYCLNVHNISRAYAYHLIKAGHIYKEMSTIVDKRMPTLELVKNEAQIRELGRLPDAGARLEVLEQLESDGDITAMRIREAVDIRLADEPKPDRKPSPTGRLQSARELLPHLEQAIETGGDWQSYLQQLKTLLAE